MGNEEATVTEEAPRFAASHTLRRSHNWDKDEKGENFVCVKGESFHFSPRALLNAQGDAGCRGCGAKVPTKLYDVQRTRWTPDASELAWIVDKVLNEVIAPCACRRCEMRRRQSPNYKGLTAKGLKKKKEETPASA